MKGLQLLPASWDPRLPRGRLVKQATGRHFHPLSQLMPHVQDTIQDRAEQCPSGLHTTSQPRLSPRGRGGAQPSPAWTPGLQSCKIRLLPCSATRFQGSCCSPAHGNTKGTSGLRQPVTKNTAGSSLSFLPPSLVILSKTLST